MAHLPIEKTEVCLRASTLSDKIFLLVQKWDILAKDTVGRQLVRSLDSVGANLIEGEGRASQREFLRFLVIARASAREARYWILRAESRGLMEPDAAHSAAKEISEIAAMINGLKKSREILVREERADYGEQDPFEEPRLKIDSLTPRILHSFIK